MDVLGLEVDVVWAQKLVRLRFMPVKASRRLAVFERLLVSRRWSAEESAKVAGRRPFAVTMSANRIGVTSSNQFMPKPMTRYQVAAAVLGSSLLRPGGEATSRHCSHLNTPQHLQANTSCVGLKQWVHPG